MNFTGRLFLFDSEHIGRLISGGAFYFQLRAFLTTFEFVFRFFQGFLCLPDAAFHFGIHFPVAGQAGKRKYFFDLDRTREKPAGFRKKIPPAISEKNP